MIVVTVGGVDRTSAIGDLTISDSINSQVDTLDFTTIKSPQTGFVPALGDEVTVTRDGSTFFGGVITTVTNEWEGPNAVRYKATCVDYSFYLNRNLVTRRYENETISAIIADLVADFAPTFTANNVVGNIIINSIAFNRITIGECLRKLSELVNYHWYVDHAKDIHFFPTNTERAPFNATSGNYLTESLTITRDLSQIRNRVLVQGGEIKDAARTVLHAGNGEQQEFDTIYKFAQLPTVTVDGVAVNVGTENLDDEADHDAMWSFNQKYVRFTTGSIPGAPATGSTNIAITGEPLTPILVNIPDPVSIDEFGEFEFTITDTSIKTRDQAIERAFAELRAWGQSVSEGSFETYRAGLRSGQVIRVTDALQDIDEDFVIQRVQYRHLSADETYSGRYTVTLASLKTVGIISVLQKLLQGEDLSQDEQVLLLTLLEASDSFTVGDTMGEVTVQTGPYYLGTAVLGFSTLGVDDGSIAFTFEDGATYTFEDGASYAFDT